MEIRKVKTKKKKKKGMKTGTRQLGPVDNSPSTD